MGRFRIEGSGVDVEALAERVEAAIEAKRGTRFTDEEIERLRELPLEPRLRREDLPRGLLGELAAVRGRLPDVPPAPGPEPASAPSRESAPELGSQLRFPELSAGDFSRSGSPGLKGRLLGALRRMARPLFKLVFDADELVRMTMRERDYTRDMVAATERNVSGLEKRLEMGFDALKDNLDRRVDRTADWAGAHMTATSGTLEQRQERALHLAHNTVVEMTNLRLDLQQMQARLNEMARRMQELETRERTLEKLALQTDDER